MVQPETRTPNLSLALMTALVSRTDNIRLREIDQIRQSQRDEIYRAVEEDRKARGKTALSHGLQENLRLLELLEKALGCKISGWAGLDLARMSAEEIGEALSEYTRDHVALQRRAGEVAFAEQRLRRSAELAIERLSGAVDA
ncbi:hypothetical protein [Acrocarpospora phusangensis]|uniref:hypothetical protein n=1 Tax=Acrocarpospora phusangensis TaxID=1070424 RepID=UPI00194E3624|nr:hypothetical protein [Acrocarpospora phusangensis]